MATCEENELDVWERIFIRYFDSLENGYNLEEGGNTHKKLTKQHKLNISRALAGKSKGKGISKSEEHKQKISNSEKGKIVSAETKQKMSVAKKKYWNERQASSV